MDIGYLARAVLDGPGKEYVGKLPRDLFSVEPALGLIPLIDPVDHAEQGKRSGARTHGAFALSLLLHLSD